MRQQRFAQRGFLLIEVLIAVLVVGLALFAAVGMQTNILRGAGDAKQRTKAMALAQANIEAARSIITETGFTGLTSGGCQAITATGFTVGCAVSTPGGGLDQRLVQVTVSWTDTTGSTQRIALNSLIGWGNVGALAAGLANPGSPNIAPLGKAKTGVGTYTPIPTGAQANNDGTYSYRKSDGTLELIAANGNILLYVPKTTSADPNFATISGRIMFDQGVNANSLPPANKVRVRLSSEGVCIYNNAVNQLQSASGGSNSYLYFNYTCYVGEGWYGNVGVAVDDDVTGQAAGPSICVGDPAFNSGVGNGFITSAHPRESAVRGYRGFKSAGSSIYLSTGMADGGTYPVSGAPKPSNFPSYYPSIPSGQDAFRHDFLLTRLTGGGNNAASCATRMAGGQFVRNAGRYLCISPDNDSAADVCPTVWPGFETEAVGSGGYINYTLSVAKSGTGTGTVTSSPGGINCGASCSASVASGTQVTLTATPASGSTFSGWSGDYCSGTSPTCTLTLAASGTVTASFTGVSTVYPVTVSKAGNGAGTVTSAPAGIDCGATCSADFAVGTGITLTATPAPGSTFVSWGGTACAGTSPTCTIASLSGAADATATFNTTTGSFALTVTRSGSAPTVGTVTSSPTGISCGATCSAAYTSGTSVTLTAAAGTGAVFGGWTGACSGSATTCTVSMTEARSVTAQFNANQSCQPTISGARKDKNNAVRIVSPVSQVCTSEGGNSTNYNCIVAVTLGSTVKLEEYRTQGNGQNATTTIYSTLNVPIAPTAAGTCPGTITNVNFQ